MKFLQHAFFCAAIGCAPAAVHAQDPIELDRPDVTNGAGTVDAGRWQFELGGLYSRHRSDSSAFASPVLVRIGLTPRLEARVGTDGLLSVADADARTTGMGNVQVGAKIRVWTAGDASRLSLLPTVYLPTASSKKGLGSGSADYTITLLTGVDLGSRARLDVNYAIGAIGGGEDQSYFVQHLVSASADVALDRHWNPFLEVYWYSRQSTDGGAVTAMDGGAVFYVTNTLAIDGGVQVGLSDAASRFAVFGGVSFRIGEGRQNSARLGRQPLRR